MNIEQLIERVKAGDAEALKTIYEAYAPMLRSVCAGISKGDEATVDDLVQEAFVRAYYSLEQLRDGGKFGEWCAAIAKNVSLRHLERARRTAVVSLSAMPEEELEVAGGMAADAVLGEKELLRLIDSLPEGYRRVFRMAVIEGYSHKEIAARLGIAPHSSSSQLARAKALLRSLISQRMLTAVAILLVSLPIFRYLLKMGKTEKPKSPVASVENKKRKKREKTAEDSLPSRTPLPPEPQMATTHQRYRPLYAPVSPLPVDSSVLEQMDSVAHGEREMASTDSILTDTTQLFVPDLKPYRPYIAETEEAVKRQHHRWQLLAAGSLGPALAENAYKLFLADKNAASDIDGPTPFIPDTISTWEEYHDYLQIKSHAGMTPDTVALKDIARNNSGKIVEREHHDKPITLGFSLTKAVDERWSLETGLQYSLLKSDFTLGEGLYYIKRKQQIHYLGLPLRVSYKWLYRKHWAAYASTGVTLNIPLYAQSKEVYVTGQTTAYTDSWRMSPSWQWAVGISIGLQYRFAPHWGLYLEPTFHWFVPNGSSIHTVWTEHPFTITVPFGIRFTW